VTYNGAPLILTGGMSRLEEGGGKVFALNTTLLAPAAYRIDVASATATLLTSTQLFPSNLRPLVSLDGVVYGDGDGDGDGRGEGGRELWRSDGTPAGTYLLHDVNKVTRGSLDGGSSAVHGNRFYFKAVDRLSGASLLGGLWRSDGTAAGTQPLDPATFGGGDVGVVARFGDGIAFTSHLQSSLAFYRVDTEFAQVQQIVQPSAAMSWLQFSSGLLTYECAGGTGSVCALRAGDGVAVSVVAAPPGVGAYEPVGAIAGVHLFFFHGALWRSDGTAPGTFVLAGLNSYRHTPSSLPFFVRSQEYAGQLFFQACTPPLEAPTCGVYGTDGTAAPTLIAAMPDYVMAYSRYQQQFVFTAGQQLWRSSGTAATTQFAVSLPRYVSSLAQAGGLLHLIGDVDAPTPYYGYFVSDTTPAGTRAVPMPPAITLAHPLFAYDEDNVLLPCYVPGLGNEFCVVDGAGTGVRQVIDINPGMEHGYPSVLARTTDALYVRARDSEHGWEPWRIVLRGNVIFADSFDISGAQERAGR